MHHGAAPNRKASKVKLEPIAIIGMSGRFPDAPDVDAFWRNVRDGRDSVTEAPRDRGWDIADYYEAKPQTRGKTYSRHGAFLPDIDRFDPLFFEIAPNTVEIMDPSARLFLEEAWRAIEDAGYASASLNGARCGLYFCAKGDYANLVQRYEETYLASTDTYVPARLAYHLNLVGPALSVDTACSSTLTALVYACDALTLGNCDVAVVGGGGLNATPNALVTSSQMLLYSPTGRCRTFSEDADGTVLGEAIAALVLKPLARAEADGDHIYGLVRGWGTNQDGRTNGLTAPSAKSQVRLQTSIYERFEIDPGTITLVEAHGTGTKLGDPIEVQALNESFRRFTPRRNYCALASVKTNIGHAFFGAGVTGVIKVLQAFRHRQIAPSLNFSRINPAIRLDDSPFYVATELVDWPTEEGQPRRAAINAFGATGINAHVVLEEYRPLAWPSLLPNPAPASPGPRAVVLSAKTGDRLRAVARRLRDRLAAEPGPGEPPGLDDVAYTLQVGRDAMSERLAFVAETLTDVVVALDRFLAGDSDDGLFRGSQPSGAMARMQTAAALRDEVTEAVARADQSALAAAWAAGASVAWSELYDSAALLRPRRIPLPTYPFEGERYWIGRGNSAVANTGGHGGRKLHPLLHVNVSDLEEHRYASTFSGEEFFLRDHRIQGARVLPGVTYLEMVRAALAHSTGRNGPLRIENVVWIRPFVFSPQNRELKVALAPADEVAGAARIDFEVYSEAEEGTTVCYCQGQAMVEVEASPPMLDIAGLRAVCARGQMSGSDLYPRLQEGGFGLGPAHQGVETLFAGDGVALGRLVLPQAAPSAGFHLHPSLLDSALQTAVGLLDPHEETGSAGPPLPFALEALDVFGPCPATMWAWVRYADGAGAKDRVVRTDIDLADDEGRVCARLRGLTSRALAKTLPGEPADACHTRLLTPVWTPAETPSGAGETDRHVIYCAAPDALGDSVAVEGRPGVSKLTTVAIKGAPAEAFGRAAAAVFEAIKAVLLEFADRARPRTPVTVQVVVHPSAAGYGLEGLSGLMRSARQENTLLTTQLVLPAAPAEPAAIADALDAEALSGFSGEVRLRAGGREVLEHQLLTASAAERPWRAAGVYLITGGLGGLGLRLAEDIAAHAAGATLLLLGRSPPGNTVLARVDRLRAAGAAVEVVLLDVADGGQTDAAVRDLAARHGPITGVIHCAGRASDNYLVNKPWSEFEQVLAPKTAGLLNLDLATRDQPLDFFVAFSSLAGAWGNAGQGDYAAANGFMDAHMARRTEAVAAGLAQGRSLSVNWPLWRDGGMRIDAAYETAMAARSGLVPLPTEDGLDALAAALATDHAQVLVAHGRLTAAPAAPAAPVERKPSRAPAAGPAPAQAILLIRRMIADLVKADPARIDIDAELSEFGLDSISLTQLSNQLNERHGISLSPTIFFEYSTIREFAGHVGELYPEEILAADADAPATPASSGPEAMMPSDAASAGDRTASGRRLRGRYLRARTASPSPKAAEPAGPERIAIIGMSAQFPMAADKDAFWRNLEAGRDCITEVPQDRWDWQAIYGDPLEAPGRTNIKWGGFIGGLGDWDPAFFSISPREAELIEPQKRLLMSHVWKAIEDAGYAPGSLAGSNTALFIGTADSGYANLYAQAGVKSDGSGTPASMGPARMSYFLDLHGPSEPVETACSSSLVAIHRGAAALREGVTDLCVVGGVQTIPTEHKHISFSQGGVLSLDGRCKTFSAHANGYVRAEGVGMLVLKRLSDAQRDGDAIYGVILASAENHGGRANSLTSPNPRAQAELLVSAYRRAGVDPRSVSYIEAHGTGTILGDPIEINGLKSAFRQLYAETEDSTSMAVEGAHCGLGSVKTNIGHAELAAGVAGVIKVLLQMQHGVLVRSLHAEELNPHIDLAGTPFDIVRENRPWSTPCDRDGTPAPRRAGVSSFGVGGVNAHVVLEECQ